MINKNNTKMQVTGIKDAQYHRNPDYSLEFSSMKELQEKLKAYQLLFGNNILCNLSICDSWEKVDSFMGERVTEKVYNSLEPFLEEGLGIKSIGTKWITMEDGTQTRPVATGTVLLYQNR